MTRHVKYFQVKCDTASLCWPQNHENIKCVCVQNWVCVGLLSTAVYLRGPSPADSSTSTTENKEISYTHTHTHIIIKIAINGVQAPHCSTDITAVALNVWFPAEYIHNIVHTTGPSTLNTHVSWNKYRMLCISIHPHVLFSTCCSVRFWNWNGLNWDYYKTP